MENKNDFKVIIAGSRDYNNYGEAEVILDKLFSVKKPTQIICGMARGADMIGYRYGKEHNIPIDECPADWTRYGRSAGYRRNAMMAKKAHALVAFWDGSSPGTKNMIEIAKKDGLAVRVVNLSK